VIWTGTALAAVPVVFWMERRAERLLRNGAASEQIAGFRALAVPLSLVVFGVFTLTTATAISSFAWPFRLAGGMALLGLLALAAASREPALRSIVWIPASWQALMAIVRLFAPRTESLGDLLTASALPAALPLAAAAALSAFLFQVLPKASPEAPSAPRTIPATVFRVHRAALRSVAALAVVASLAKDALLPLEAAAAAATFSLLLLGELRGACRGCSSWRVWAAETIAAAAVLYFVYFGLISLGHGISMYALVGCAFLFHALSRAAARGTRTAVMAGPFLWTSRALPLAAVAIGVVKHFAGSEVRWLGANSLALLFAAGFYFWRGMEERRKGLFVLAGGVVNAALVLLWRELEWSDPQLYLVPMGASLLALVELLREEIPRAWRDPLRYAGALVILVSPVSHIVEGSWLHLLCLMGTSASIVLVAIGTRVRAMMYTGTAFLVADLAAMVVRGSVENRNVLWFAGLSLGGLIIFLAALCENRREVLLQKLRLVAASLERWD
jgi:hypothetical protein